MNMQILDGKTIVIIGGTSGIGLSAATACLDAGARVTLTGVGESVAEAKTMLANSALVIESDARTPGSAADAIASARERFGAFDGLYHVAGGSGRRYGDGPLHEVTDEGWEETIRLNQTSVFYSNRAAVRALQESGGGAIVNLTSVLAYAPSPTHFSTHAYAAAKAAIIGLTQSAAACYARDNIRVNAIAPGLTDTPMAARARGDAEIQAFAKAKQPLDGGRMGTPKDLDGLAVFLLSDAARFMTGQIIAVDGGWSVT